MIALYHTHPDQLDFTAQVLSCQPSPRGEGLWEVILSDTAFYPTGGGQPCDGGTLGGCPVEAVEHEEDEAPIVHIVRSDCPLSGTVTGHVDAARRLDHTQQHSGQHMLSHVLYERFGAYSLGLHVGAQDSYVDLAPERDLTLTREIADEIEEEVNQWIAQDEPVRCFFPTPEELSALPLRKKPDAHENLRIVCIGAEEAVACCGTHVRTTGQVQAVHILSWQQSHGNLRIFFVAGLRAVRYAWVRSAQAEAAARLFSCSISDLVPSIERLKAQNAELAHQLAAARKAAVTGQLSSLQPVEAPKGLLYIACVEGADDAQLRDGLALLTRDARAVCFLCAPVANGYAVALGVGSDCPLNAGQALRSLLALLGGKGGGRADSAFGRSPRMDLNAVRAWLTEALS